MRLSRFHLATVKEIPADAEIASHRLMLRTGMIRKLAAGIYTWSPLGLRVLTKVANVVREEMNRAGALELLMPSIQPKELWEETGRWEKFGGQLLKIKDRKEASYCYGPTHEEVITDYARNELKSYKQLPVNFYQIQTKFRDEIRPRFGVMRAREFLMASALFWRAYRAWVQPDIPPGGVDVFGCTRAFRDDLLALGEANSSLIGQLFWLGQRRVVVPYERLARKHGRSAWSFSRKLKYLMDSLFAFSDLPVRLLMLIGMLGLVTAFVLGATVLGARLLGAVPIPGYAMTMITLLFFGALNTFGLGLIGAYVWRAYENTKQRPLAVVYRSHAFDGVSR